MCMSDGEGSTSLHDSDKSHFCARWVEREGGGGGGALFAVCASVYGLTVTIAVVLISRGVRMIIAPLLISKSARF